MDQEERRIGAGGEEEGEMMVGMVRRGMERRQPFVWGSVSLE